MNRRGVVGIAGTAVVAALALAVLNRGADDDVQADAKAERSAAHLVRSVTPKLGPKAKDEAEKRGSVRPATGDEPPESAQPPVFSVNGKSFRSLQAAVDAAKDGDTITLTGNAYVRNPVSVKKNLRVDLNGFRLRAENSALAGGRASRKGIRTAGAHAITVEGRRSVVVENGGIDVVSNDGWNGFTGAVETVPDQTIPADAAEAVAQPAEQPAEEVADAPVVPNDDANFDVVLRDLEITSDAARDGAFRNAEGKMLIDNCTVDATGGNGSYTLGDTSETTIRSSQFNTTGTEGELSYWNNTIAAAYDGKVTVESGTYVTRMAEGMDGTTYGTFVYSSGGTIDIRGGEFQADHVAQVTKDMASYGETYGVSEIAVKDGALSGALETVATGEGAEDAAGISLYGGFYDNAPKPEQVPEGSKAVDCGDGTYSVERIHEASSI